MSKRIILGIGIVLLVALLAVVAYVLRPPAEASQPIEAVPIQADEAEDAGQETDSEDAGEATSAETEGSAAAEATEEDAEVTEAEETEAEETEAEEAESAVSEPVTFAIVQAESEARFSLGEILRGNPVTVVGATDQVAGEISVDFSNPSNSQIGPIQVNARTLVTDNDFRNRAIKNEILDTGDFEFISFTPTSINGLPESVSIGEEIVFTITGDLTVRDITNQVTFDAKVTAVSETQLQGYASTIVARADYDLQIPSVPSVADVDEDVLVEIEFTATAK